MSITVRLDYATVNFAPGQMSYTQVSRRLLGEDGLFWRQKGLNENSPMVSPLGLRWQENNGYAALPHKLEISGVGCAHFFPLLPDLVADTEHRFSRLDFAFDVLIKKSDWRQFICRAFESSLSSDRQRKQYRLAGQGEAMTIYIGSRRSAKFFRIYNKTLEDPKYTFIQDGVETPVPADSCVIRYEVELHRHHVHAQNDIRTYDPSPAFAWYFGSSEDQSRLCDTIRDLWLSFGDEVLLPQGFDTADIVCLTHDQNKNFVSKEEAMLQVKENLHDYPHSFEHTLNYLVDRFGKYIPYIVADKDYMNSCHESCKFHFGFVPEYYLEQYKPSGFYDLDPSNPVDTPIEIPWEYEQLELAQLEFDESEVL